jgi:hypothetical protein
MELYFHNTAQYGLNEQGALSINFGILGDQSRLQ